MTDPTEENQDAEVGAAVVADPAPAPMKKESPPPVQASIMDRLYAYVIHSFWPGMGLFGESYILFSVGTMKPLWKEIYPECWGKEASTCSTQLTQSLSYSVVLGVICGQIGFGSIAAYIGRRRGSIATATIMALGAVFITLIGTFVPNNSHALFVATSVLLSIFGVGVGGEYPMSASSASEKAMETDVNPDAKRHTKVFPSQELRGRSVQLVFTGQGLGIVVNSIIMTLMLIFTGQTGSTYDPQKLKIVWYITYAVGAMILIFVLGSRIKLLKESTAWKDDREKRKSIRESFHDNKKASDAKDQGKNDEEREEQPIGGDEEIMPVGEPCNPTILLLRHFGMRLFGTCMTWFLWDVSFYGNKLFQSTFIEALTGPNTTLTQLGWATTLNATVALVGYYGAALLVDKVGRFWLQQIGFLLSGVLFLAVGYSYESISSGVLVTLYMLSSFFGQLGPNCTTFLIPSEIFPTNQRSLCHGTSAALGKCGALLASILFNYIGDVPKFLICGWTS